MLQIRAKDEAGVSALTAALGSGDELKSKLNQALEAQGLEPSTDVSNPQVQNGESGSGGFSAFGLSQKLKPCLMLCLCLSLSLSLGVQILQ